MHSTTPPPFVCAIRSSLPDAGTDARVYLDLFGSSGGQLLDLHLRDTGATFNDGAEDTFFFPSPGNMGDIASVCISHDDSGAALALALGLQGQGRAGHR